MKPSGHTLAVLVVIPARGGSKGIPRKNLRSLAGRPLLQYAIDTARASAHSVDVVVSTDDDEIALVAERCGATVHRRPPALAEDKATLDPVIADAVVAAEAKGRSFDLVVTLQPTSPLLRTASLDAAIDRLAEDSGIDTVISAVNDTHLTWRADGTRFVPNYVARVNRQYLPVTYRESGGFLITRRRHVTPTNRIGPNVYLHELPSPESIDIDGHEDWGLCSYFLRRRRVLFVVTGHAAVGLGHVHNSLLVANDIVEHEVAFLVDRASTLAFQVIAERNYPVSMQTSNALLDDIARWRPHVVVNDRLDTDSVYMAGLRDLGVKSVNVEDLGPGAELADAVVNAIYPDRALAGRPSAYFGPSYACLRDEFQLAQPRDLRPTVERVLVTFGGTDPSGNTVRVLEAIEPWCREQGIAIDVVTGLGFGATASLERFGHARVHRNVQRISEFMLNADVAFTSAGRTVFELASLGTPSIVLAQNERELTHTFASEENGFVHLGQGTFVTPGEILGALKVLVADTEQRAELRKRMLRTDLRIGRINVARIIDDVVRST